MVYWDVSDDPIIPDADYFTENFRFQFLTDTPNTVFQIIAYAKFAGSASAFIAQQGDYFGEFTITEAEPHPYAISINNFSGTTGSTGIEVGFAIRNMTSGSNLYLCSGAGMYDGRAWPAPV